MTTGIATGAIISKRIYEELLKQFKSDAPLTHPNADLAGMKLTWNEYIRDDRDILIDARGNIVNVIDL